MSDEKNTVEENKISPPTKDPKQNYDWSSDKNHYKIDPKTGRPKEYGGPSGPDPIRYQDWERKGICRDF